jgi:DNA topoisomerase-1
MSKTLVIVESPGKIKKIQEILGNGYIAKASFGHIYDLPEKGMNVDIENNFKPHYEVKYDKKKVVAELKAAVAKCSNVILATDDDAEGEFIAWSLMTVLKLKDPDRIVFGSITKKEILNAVKKGGKINYDKVHSQQARRIFDRLEGYELSDLVRKCVQHGGTAGRVQSIVTKIIVDRETEVEKFYKEGSSSFYKVNGVWKLEEDSKDTLDSVLYKRKSKSKQKNDSESDTDSSSSDSEDNDNKDSSLGGIAKIKVNSKTNPPEEIIEFLKKCQKSDFIIGDVYNKKKISQPSAPYNTLSLQQDAFNKHGFSMTSTMKLAQVLYEKGLITYMRTDSISLSKEAMDDVKDHVIEEYGKDYYRHKIWATKDKSAQEAHEAIRPTHIEKTPNDIKLDDSLKKLYSLIWKRTVGSQMTPAEFSVKHIEIISKNINPYYFLAKYERLIFDGYMILYESQSMKDGKKTDKTKYSNIKINDDIYMNKITATQEWSKSPARYTQASLLSQLKKLGIGRPATYAKMIQIVQDRNYVRIDDIKGTEIIGYVLSITADDKKIKEEKKKTMLGQEKKKFIPTDLGKMVNTFLTKNFDDVMDYKFTANMETELDAIRNGKKEWTKVLKKHYDLFSPQVKNILKNIKDHKIVDQSSRVLGQDPDTELDIVATIAKYGPVVKKYITEKKCIYAPIKKPLTLETITMKDALKLFEYPKKLGKYLKKDVVLYRGEHGLYLKHAEANYSLTVKDDPDLDDAIEFIEEKKKLNAAFFENDKTSYSIRNGKFGHFIIVKEKKKKGKSFLVSVPEKTNIKDLTLESVQELVKNNPPNKNKWKKKTFNKKSATAKSTVKKKTNK